MTTRRRHVRPAPDDPRLPRKFRQDSGVNLMHEDDWYGFNVANKMPTRGDTDPALNPFTGFPGGILEVDAIGNPELAPDAVLNGNIGEQINATKLPDLAGHNGNLPGGRISGNIDVSNLPVNIPANNVPNIQNLNGVLPIGQTEGSLGPGRVPGLGRLNGKIKAHSQIDWGSGSPPVPAGKVSKGYDYGKLENRPNLKKFLTRSDFRADGTLKR